MIHSGVCRKIRVLVKEIRVFFIGFGVTFYDEHNDGNDEGDANQTHYGERACNGTFIREEAKVGVSRWN